MTDPASLKVVELRAELSNRNLSTKGKKNELVARLTEAMEAEQATHDGADNNEQEATSKEEEEDKAEKEEKVENAQPAEEPSVNETETLESNKESDKKDNEVAENKDEKVNQPVENDKQEEIKEEANEKEVQQLDEEKLNEKVQETKEIQEPKETPVVEKKEPVERNESIEKKESSSMEIEPERGEKRKGEYNENAEEKRMKREEDNEIVSSAIIVKGFVRPLIVRQAQDLFAKYGNVKRFWMDSIKTHCYVIYETIEEAKKAYNQVNGIIFPSDTGRKLIVGGLTPEQAESLIEYEQSAAEQRLRVNWEDVIQKVKAGEPIPSSPASDTRKTRSVGIGQIAKQLAQAASPPEKTKTAQPEHVREEKRGLSLDDLFQKTKTLPHLYYLPVSEEEARARLDRMKSSA
ncbi:hypothetical protein G6F70_005227 [Rhizopus microsporus]|uniref:SAP domain-containing protein n=2 Tax=Rhizopus TaxID=4842 RepID=A0A367JFH8_RHIAZ|nr:hypothetical protein G6F71_004150 [Rhizopus microsporus]RCH88619.1 hypothetical protein CU097_009371 [Rhizopus azygosporus]KAG1199093.1 hypothetical protein G6F70_005227 [Rhizopus microsporus]KAG1211669.1 hypothetical protein G6F69_004387 [Rhizopus microsporus]KAG1232716.1 hypothetical protein G6F67_004805 [Rhizopus microsporus]